MVKCAVIPVSMDLLRELLRLPEDLEVLHIAVGNYGLTLDLVITAPDMAETDPLATPLRVDAVYELVDGAPHLVSVNYPRQSPAGGTE